MKKRTKIIILSAMVVLLGVTGYLNIMLNKSISNQEIETGTTNSCYFASYRQDRESSRERELSYYNAIIDSTEPASEESEKAKSSMLELVAQIEKELVVEGLIKGLGFDDCIMTITPANFNVVVKSDPISQEQANQIYSIVTEQLNADFESVIIMDIV